MKYVKFFKEISKDDIPVVGGKCANLGEMVNLKLPVPPGFSVTANGFKKFLKVKNLDKKIFKILGETDVNNSKQLEDNTKKVRDMIMKASVPVEIKNEIFKAYEKTFKKSMMKYDSVIARSSATAEDLPDASFAGQQISVYNIRNKKELLDAVKQCWASLYTARSTFYRESKGFKHEKVLIAVAVQKHLKSDKSGVGFTIHPSTGNKDQVMVEGSWGQGDMVVSGAVTPDTYILNKKDGKIIEKHISSKEKMKVFDDKKGGLKVVQVPPKKQKIPALSDSDLKRLHELALKLEKHYRHPQDFEWAIEGGAVYLVQTRAVTVLFKKDAGASEEIKEPPILKGLPASPGVATGPVKIIKNPSQLYKIKEGDVMVTKMTDPDYVPAMKRASAIVTDEGGVTSHAAIVSRELGTVCVVGTGNATAILKDGQIITIDGKRGNVYNGKVEIKIIKEKYKYVKTDTRIYMNLGQPDIAKKYKDVKCDGIGLFRAEFMAAELGVHPKLLIEKGGQKEFIKKFAEGMKRVAKTFYPRPVVYRALDFKTNEYRGLKGGKKYEIEENNPMIGWRGASRYITEPEVFELELEAMKKVRKKYSNLWLMIPFVRSTWEIREIRKSLEKVGLEQSSKFKLWMMVEVPSTTILIEDFIKEGLDGVSIGSNDLTQLTLGVDRDSSILGGRWFNELDPAVLWGIERVVKACKKHGVTSSICGQAPSVYPELTEKLVKWGITSISVNPDVVDKTRHLVGVVEGKIKE
jgi:pyruvate,water dikinase